MSFSAIATLTTLTITCLSSPALAQTTSGFNPQDWMQAALQWVDGLGFWGLNLIKGYNRAPPQLDPLPAVQP